MRTKTLLLTAALGAAGVTSALGQVYSVNAVGYINTALSTGFNLVSNQLNTGGNTVAEVHPTAPAATLLYTFSPTPDSRSSSGMANGCLPAARSSRLAPATS